MRLLIRMAVAALVIPGAAPLRARIIDVPGDTPEIQSAIGQASPGDTVLVQPGTYAEAVAFWGKAITVTGTAPRDSAVVAATVIRAPSTRQHPLSVVRFTSNEGPLPPRGSDPHGRPRNRCQRGRLETEHGRGKCTLLLRLPDDRRLRDIRKPGCRQLRCGRAGRWSLLQHLVPSVRALHRHEQ